MSNLVDSMISLQGLALAAKSEAEKQVFRRQIDATEAEIDQMVYDLYGLTAKEIAVVKDMLNPETRSGRRIETC